MNATNYKPSHLVLMGAFALLMSGCKQPTTVPPSNTDRFKNSSVESYAQANKVLRGDYLFVVDYSFSMYNKTLELANSLDKFAEDLLAQDIDYRIGFIRGNFHGTASSSEINAWTPKDFITGSFIVPGLSSSLKAEIYDKVSPVGNPLQQNRVVLFESARKTLKNRGGDFLRPEAQLIVVMVSDSDDTSETYKSQYNFGGSVSDYAAALKAFKLPNYINGRAIVAGVDGCGLENSWDVAGTKIAQLAKAIDSAPVPPNASCIYDDFNESLGDLARNVTRLTNRYRMQMTPISGTLTVTVNGVDVPAAGNWSFDTTTNEVVFLAGKEPAAAASVSFQYQVKFVLTTKPKADTLKVEVNGVVVPKSDSNGWSYISAENRIVFNGAAQPPGGADIRVTYEILR